MTTADISFNLGAISDVANGMPDWLLTKIGKQVASDQGRRIRQNHTTVDGETLDPNDPDYLEEKLASGGISSPLANTGAMSEPNAWEVSIVSGSMAMILLTLSPELQPKWDDIIEISERKGNNWNQAWGVGEFELTQLSEALKNWFKSKGVS